MSVSVDPPATRSAGESAAEQGAEAHPPRTHRSVSTGVLRSQERHRRRLRQLARLRFTSAGRPLRSAWSRVTVVLLSIVLLGGGITGVLVFTTLADAYGLQASNSRAAQQALGLQIEAAKREVADLDAVPRIAGSAAAMGMIPMGEVPMLVVDRTGGAGVIGSPSPVLPPMEILSTTAAAAGVTPTPTPIPTAPNTASAAPVSTAATAPITQPDRAAPAHRPASTPVAASPSATPATGPTSTLAGGVHTTPAAGSKASTSAARPALATPPQRAEPTPTAPTTGVSAPTSVIARPSAPAPAPAPAAAAATARPAAEPTTAAAGSSTPVIGASTRSGSHT